MEADPDLIEIDNDAATCIKRNTQPWIHCIYAIDQPRDDECDGGSTRPCGNKSVIFVPKLDYLTWKLTQ